MANSPIPPTESAPCESPPEGANQVETPRDRRLWQLALALYALIVCVQSCFQIFINSENWRTAGIAGSDGQAYYAYVRSLIVDGDLDFENELFEYNYNRHGFHTRKEVLRSPLVHSKGFPGHGRIFFHYGIGYALMHLPFFLAAHAVAHVLPHVAPDGYSLPYQFAVPLAGILWGLLALATTRRLMLRYARPTVATLASVTLFLSYQGAFSVITFWCNPHVQSLVVFNLMLLTASNLIPRDGKGIGRWALLGALTGLGGLLRIEQLAFGLLPATLAATLFWHDTRQTGPAGAVRNFVIRGASCLLACGVVFLLQIVAWRVMWGAWFHVSVNNPGQNFNWTSPVFLKVLFSTRHGLFYWSPVLLLGAIGLGMRIAQKRIDVAILSALPVLFVLYYTYASWSVWWMGYSFGARQFISLTAFFAIGLASLYDMLWRRRILLALLSIVLVGWNQIMLWLFLNGHIPRSYGFAPWLPLVRFAELLMRKLGG